VGCHSLQSDTWPPSINLCFLPYNQFSVHLSILPLIPCASSFKSNVRWGSLSNAFRKSSYITSTGYPCPGSLLLLPRKAVNLYIVKSYVYPTPPSTSRSVLLRPVCFQTNRFDHSSTYHLLELFTNSYVHVFTLPSLKALCTVWHTTLMEKMVQLLIPHQFYNWLKDFFSGYSHCIKWSSSSDNGADSVSSNTAPHWESWLTFLLASSRALL